MICSILSGMEDGKIVNEAGSVIFENCPECDENAIYQLSTGWLSQKFLCDNCGYEAEREEVAKSLRRVLKDIHQESKDKKKEREEKLETVCRECREIVSKDAKRCSHCGFKPKKRGGLWYTSSILLGWTPIGAIMGYDALTREATAGRVWEQVERDEDGESGELSENDHTETLEQLKHLCEKGVITEQEFEEKKREILERL